MMENRKPVKPGDIITSIERGLNVLRVFDQNAVDLTPADVAKRTGLPRATARRVLLTLEKLGYAVTDGKHYRLTPKVLDLSHGYLAKVKVKDLIEPILHEAMLKTQESCVLMIRDGNEMLCIASSNPTTMGYVSFDTGERVPIYRSSPGRMFMAYMSNEELSTYLGNVKLVQLTAKTITRKSDLKKYISVARDKGYAFSIDEYAIGIFGMAVPVVDESDKFLAGVSCMGNAARVKTKKARDHILTVLTDAAEQISTLLPNDYDFSSDRSSRDGH
jgi:IclR family pca regulon transcriptional regulator